MTWKPPIWLCTDCWKLAAMTKPWTAFAIGPCGCCGAQSGLGGPVKESDLALAKASGGFR